MQNLFCLQFYTEFGLFTIVRTWMQQSFKSDTIFT